MADPWEDINRQIEGFRLIPRAPGRSFLGADGRLSMDAVDEFYEEQEEPARSSERSRAGRGR